jgi:hypothetical protein
VNQAPKNIGAGYLNGYEFEGRMKFSVNIVALILFCLIYGCNSPSPAVDSTGQFLKKL